MCVTSALTHGLKTFFYICIRGELRGLYLFDRNMLKPYEVCCHFIKPGAFIDTLFDSVLINIYSY